MVRLVRGLISLLFVASIVWCSFNVPLGRRTFAEHADRIGDTPEAKELLDSTRQTVTPALQDATDRMLGEYIEAPTTAPGVASSGPPKVPEKERVVPARATGGPRSGRRLPRAD